MATLLERRPGSWELIVPIGRDALTGKPKYRSRSDKRTNARLVDGVEAPRLPGLDNR